MNYIKQNLSLVLGVMGLVGLAGCAGPRMVAPRDIATGSKTLEVADRSMASGAFVNEDFKLGSWKVTEVDRDWSGKSGFSVGGYGASSTKTGFSYQLEASHKWKGACAAVKSEKGFGNFSWGASTLVCECKAGDTSALVKLAGKDAKKHTEGEVTLGAATLKISLVEETDGSNFTGMPAGYRADKDAKPAGAVEVLKPGRVWLAADMSPSDSEALSCVFVGLMLYVPPSDG